MFIKQAAPPGLNRLPSAAVGGRGSARYAPDNAVSAGAQNYFEKIRAAVGGTDMEMGFIRPEQGLNAFDTVAIEKNVMPLEQKPDRLKLERGYQYGL